VFAEVDAMFTNTVPTDAYHLVAGRPEACFVLERLIEQAAVQTGMDRMELRRKNFIKKQDMPYATPLGPIYDSGEFSTYYLNDALEVSDYAGFEKRRTQSKEKGMIRGFGICYFLESSGVAPSKYAGMFGARAWFFRFCGYSSVC
jgi:carbon-monoxide dehydrogenase large subunit